MSKENSSHCAYLWTHLCIRTDKRISPCCRFIFEDYPVLQLSEDVESSFNTELHRDIRKKMLNGESIKGCQKCYDQESVGGLSLRHYVNSRYHLEKDLSEISSAKSIQSLEIFLGNTCNLKCLMCRPELSSSWVRDYKKLSWDYSATEAIVEDYTKLVGKLDFIEHIKFVGGEPLLIPKHLEILRTLAKKDPSKINLEYSTNVTIFPSEEIVNLWKCFKSVYIALSVDGYGEVNSYIRYPSKWNEVLSNTHKFLVLANNNDTETNFKIVIVNTVSLYNIWNLKEAYQWFLQLKDQYTNIDEFYYYINEVRDPVYLAVNNLPNEYKKNAIQKVQSVSEDNILFRPIMNILCEKTDIFDETVVSYTKSLDKLRGVDLRDYIPELADLIYSK